MSQQTVTQNKKEPLRRCVGCGEMKSKKQLIRVVKIPEDDIKLDKTGRMNGRGAYICDSLECLKKARKSRGIERSFKMSIPETVYAGLEADMEN